MDNDQHLRSELVQRSELVGTMLYNIRVVLHVVLGNAKEKIKQSIKLNLQLDQQNKPITPQLLDFIQTYNVILSMVQHAKRMYSNIADLPILHGPIFIFKIQQANNYVHHLQNILMNNIKKQKIYLKLFKLIKLKV